MSDIFTKTQRISSAMYFVTSFFDDREPLKWRLRTLALDLAGDMVKDKFNISKEILSLFTIAKNTNLISEDNHSILVAELSKLGKEVENPLYQMFFHEVPSGERILPPQNMTGTIKDKNVMREQGVVKHEVRAVALNKPLKEFGVVSVKKNSRQGAIIGLLKRKREIMIKDIAPLVTGCSEKTIQRELLAMVADGILRKIGEKRWSRYCLAGSI
ncbi:MAG: hypothetical protein EXS69_00955 [Candidatus Zambryskibacteria bacterium]|nr:hypothetical protein [Candidatus Zambryskibacteria bacterium]